MADEQREAWLNGAIVRAGLTQAGLARILGVTPTAVYQMSARGRVAGDMVPRIAVHLTEADAAELYRRAGIPREHLAPRLSRHIGESQ